MAFQLQLGGQDQPQQNNVTSGNQGGGFKLQFGGGGSPSPTQNQQQPTPTPQQQQQQQPQQKFDIGGIIKDLLNPKSVHTLVQGIKNGGSELGALFTKMSEDWYKTDPLSQLLLDKKTRDSLNNNKWSSELYQKASDQAKQDTANLSPAQKFVYGTGQFVPAMAIPIPGAEEAGIALKAEEAGIALKAVNPILAGVVKGGIENAAQSALLYNPADHKDGNQLQSFLSDTATNFVFGLAAKTGEKIILAPMKYAFKAITDSLGQHITEQAYQNIIPTLLHTADGTQVSISSKDLFDVLKGNKPAGQFDFFQSPQWRDVIKEYGANPDNYPEIIKSPKPIQNPIVESALIPKLPSPELHASLNSVMEQAVDDMASGNADHFAMSSAVLSDMADEFQKRGWNVDRQKLMQGVTDVANYRRALDDFNMGVLKQQTDKAVLDNLDQNGSLKPLYALQKIYRLLQSKGKYTDAQVSQAFSSWLHRNNLGGVDEFSERLKNLGYQNVSDPGDLIHFAMNLPTLEDVGRKIPMPNEVNITDVIHDSITTKLKNVDTPYIVSPAELAKAQHPSEATPVEYVKNFEDKVLKKESLGDKAQEQTAPKPKDIPLPKGVKDTVGKAMDIVNEVRSRISPATMGKKAEEAAGIIREFNSRVANDKVVEHLQNKKMEAQFDKLSVQDRLNLIDNYERTGLFAPGMEAYSTLYKETTDKAHQILQDVFGLEGYVDNYIKRAFKFTDPNEEARFSEGFTKSLAKYSTTPLKQRKYVTLKDAMDYMTENNIKFQIVESNPEVLRQWTINNAKAAQAFSLAKTELKDNELIRFVRSGDKLKPNEEYLNDRWANVMFKSDSGMVNPGRYVAPKEVATVLNNAVSKGLMDISPTFRYLQEFNNALNQFQLGISAFHLATTTVNSMASELGLATQELFGKGQQASALMRALKGASIVGAVISDYHKGSNFIHLVEGGDETAVKQMNDIVNRAGGRVNIENRYRTMATDKFRKALEENKKLQAGFQLPFAVLEQFSLPIMERFVPRVKLGRFLTEADSALARAINGYTKELSTAEQRKLLGTVWDKIDNVHGQMVQDNLFWSNMQKDIANLALRSFGWTYGTLRLAGTATKESITTPWRLAQGGEAITPSMGAVLAYPIAVGMIGGIMNYMNTGKAPQEMMDYFFPRTGQTDTNGRPIRVSTPGYMKDFFSYMRSPVETLINKMSPEMQTIGEIYKNADYYGVMVYNPDDPAAQQAFQVGSYLVSKLEPFSFRSFTQIQSDAQKLSTKASGRDLLEGFLGFQKAGVAVSTSPLETMIQNAYKKQLPSGTMTPEDWKNVQAKSAAKKAAMKGDYSQLEKLLQEGVYTSKGYNTVVANIEKQQSSGYDSYQEMFSKLSYQAQQRIYSKMSKQDQAKYQPLLKQPPE